jgi:NitT/TauT family transport system substrate-binding protein
MVGASNTGRVDATLIAEPVLSDALANGSRVLGYAYDAVAPTFMIGAWFTTGAWAKAHADTVKRFQKAMSASAAWANKNRAQSAQILTKATKIDVLPTMKRTTYAEKLDPALWKRNR